MMVVHRRALFGTLGLLVWTYAVLEYGRWKYQPMAAALAQQQSIAARPSTQTESGRARGRGRGSATAAAGDGLDLPDTGGEGTLTATTRSTAGDTAVCSDLRDRWHAQPRTRPSQKPIVIVAGQGTTGTTWVAQTVSVIINRTVGHYSQTFAPQTVWSESVHGEWIHALSRLDATLHGHRRDTDHLETFDFDKWLPKHIWGIADTPIPDIFPYIFRSFPNAQVILTTRNAAEWVRKRESKHPPQTGNAAVLPFASHFLPNWAKNQRILPTLVWPSADRMAHSTLMYEVHNILVRCMVPPEQLLELNVFETDDQVLRHKLKEFLTVDPITATIMRGT